MPQPLPLAVAAFNDNYLWLIPNQAHNAAWVVDPGDAQPILSACQAHGLKLEGILLTHHHADHQGGVEDLLQAYPGLPVYGPDQGRCRITHPARADQPISLFNDELHMHSFAVPGHTLDHIAYYEPTQGWLFCGDTLFSAGCGRVFEGSMAQMLDALNTIKALPDATQIYCAHEYTLANLAFAAQVEPHNQAIQRHTAHCQAQRDQGLPTLPSNLAREKNINPFLRCDQATVRASVEAHSKQSCPDEASVFAALRLWKDRF